MFRFLAHPKFIRPLAILLWMAGGIGCAWHPGSKITSFLAPRKVSSFGPVASPGSVTTQDTHTAIPVLPGMTVTISTQADADPAPGNNISKDKPVPQMTPAVVLSSHTEQTRGVTNFTPPAPPSAAEQSMADGVSRFYWLAVFCGAAAILAGYTEHLKAAGCFAIAAAGIPFLIHLGYALAAYNTALICICVGVTLVAAWYIARHNPQLMDEIKAKAEQLRAQAKRMEGS